MPVTLVATSAGYIPIPCSMCYQCINLIEDRVPKVMYQFHWHLYFKWAIVTWIKSITYSNCENTLYILCRIQASHWMLTNPLLLKPVKYQVISRHGIHYVKQTGHWLIWLMVYMVRILLFCIWKWHILLSFQICICTRVVYKRNGRD